MNAIEATSRSPWCATYDDEHCYSGPTRALAIAALMEELEDDFMAGDLEAYDGEVFEVTVYRDPVWCTGIPDDGRCTCGMSHMDFDDHWLMLSHSGVEQVTLKAAVTGSDEDWTLDVEFYEVEK